MTEKRRSQASIGSFSNTAKGEGLTAVKNFMGDLDKQEEAEKERAKSMAPRPRKEELPQKPKMSEEEVTDAVNSLDDQIDNLESVPELSYADKVARHGITVDKAEEIVDSMIVDGFYEETYALTKKHAVTFRTRTLEDQNRIMERIEVLKPHYPSTLSNLVAQYNVASSLVQFKEINFLELTFENKLKWVRECPDGVVRALAMKLNKFDSMIADVMSEGAIENF